MTIQEFFTEECENIFLTHKKNLMEQTSFNEKNRNLKDEDIPKFNREFKSFQRKISLNLTKLVKKNRKANVEEFLEPIANNYSKKFLNLIDLSKYEMEKKPNA